MYEAPTSLGFSPSLFVDVEGFVERKLEAIGAHESQVLKNRLVDLEAVAAQARFRGFQARLHYAEGFQAERFTWEISDPIERVNGHRPYLMAIADSG